MNVGNFFSNRPPLPCAKTTTDYSERRKYKYFSGLKPEQKLTSSVLNRNETKILKMKNLIRFKIG